MASRQEQYQHQDQDPRFVGAVVDLANDLGQSFGWWEDSGSGQGGGAPTYVMPPPVDYTNTIIGVAAGLAAIVLIAIIILR